MERRQKHAYFVSLNASCIKRYSLIILTLAAFASATPALAQDSGPVFYVSEHKVSWDRIDSLTTLISRYQIPFEEYISENVEGYQRFFYTHDTGDEYNYFVVTVYPDWDYVHGDEIDRSELVDRYTEEQGISEEELERLQEGFQYVMEGSTHRDRILRPITAEEEED